MKKSEFLHQGDVQMFAITELPQNAKSVDKKPVALGEQSGHQHVITGDYDLLEDDKGNVFATIGNDGATLQHIHESNFGGTYEKNVELPVADHNRVELTPNTTYEIGIHRKYDPWKKVFEKVQD